MLGRRYTPRQWSCFLYLTYIDIEVDEKRLLLPYDLNINDVMATLNLKCRVFQP